MTDLVGARSIMQIEETDFRSAISEPLIKKIGSNINSLIDSASEEFQVGTLFWAYLTLAQVQAALDNTWVLCDGANVAGSDLDTTYGISVLPDARARWVRGLDEGGGVDAGAPRTNGDFQSSSVQAHVHNLIADDDAQNVFTFPNPAAPFIGTRFSNNVDIQSLDFGSLFFSTDQGTQQGETRPFNVAFNLFIKINT